MDKEALVTLTADVVAAHVSNNHVAIGDLGDLVQRVHDALAGLGKPAEREQEPRRPAVSVRSSVKPDAITCLVCGKKQRTLKRHISTAHGMTPVEYREAFALPASYPLVAPNYSAQRSEMAKSIGLGRKKGSAGKPGAKPKAKRASAA
jgi:predicted transcriptional regulator